MYLETLSPDLELTTDNVRKAMACARSSCVCQRLGSPDKIKTHCPAHDDGTPSLSMSLKDGKFLVHCYAGCDQAAVVEALNFKHLRSEQRNSGRRTRWMD